VILVTLVGGGLALPTVIRALHLAPSDNETDELRRALIALDEAALEHLRQLEVEHRIEPHFSRALREQYVAQQERLAATDAETGRRTLAQLDVERELGAARRRKLVQLHKSRSIDTDVLRRLQRSLDRQESEIARKVADLQHFDEDEAEDRTPPDP